MFNAARVTEKWRPLGDQSGLEKYFDEFRTSLEVFWLYLYLIGTLLGFVYLDARISVLMYF